VTEGQRGCRPGQGCASKAASSPAPGGATVLALAFAVAITSLTGGCEGRPDTGPHMRDRLVVARPSDATNLDPARAADIESLEVAEQVFGRLVRFSAGHPEPEPDLATRWQVSADGTVWTFDLRPGVVFHDGTPFDADAVVFSFERQLLSDHPAHEPDFVWVRNYRNIKRVVALDRLRVQFQIDRPFAPFLANLAIGPAAIVSPTAVRRYGTRFGRHPVGTGPYRFLEWIPGDRITLERNVDYWDQPARTRYLVMLTLRDSRQRMQAIESGAADVIEQLDPEDIPLVRLDPDLRLVSAPASLVSYVALNTRHRPFDDPRIRRAVAHAIRRDAIVRFVYQGLATAAVGPLPPNVWGARQDLPSFTYDPERARELFAEAGFSGAASRPLKLFIPSVPRQYVPSPERVAAVIRSCLEEVGFPVEIVAREPAELQRALWAGDHDLALTGWSGTNGDPDDFLYNLLDPDNAGGAHPSNIAFFSNPAVHDIILSAQRTTDRAERERLYARVQTIIAIDAPWVPLAHPMVVFATRADVTGLAVQSSAIALYRAVGRAL
jgi:peptide/nickel transport system substrate-binding protein